MVPAYHTYLARCQAMLRRGLPVADILYLDLEGRRTCFARRSRPRWAACPTAAATISTAALPACLIHRCAAVKDGRIVFPDGMSYRLLVLPRVETMTPPLLRKIKQLVDAGATVVGAPPKQSPSLENYPQCDAEVQQLAGEIWRGNRVFRDGPAAKWPPETAWRPRSGFGTTKASPRSGAGWETVLSPRGGDYRRPRVGGVYDDGRQQFHAVRQWPRGWDRQQFPPTVHDRCGAVAEVRQQRHHCDRRECRRGAESCRLDRALAIRFHDGTSLSVSTDKRWSSALASDGQWHPVIELGGWDMAPWKLTPATSQFPDIYPIYEATAQILAKMNVLPDFESDGDVRYTHRHDQDAEIYFVGNRTAAAVSAACRFRVTGRQPEFWNPVTGERRALPEFREQDGRTIVPLRFAPGQSYFVVFRKGPRPSGTNFPEVKPIAELTGPWEVHFVPKWGGPERVKFAVLEDWRKRPEDGIRFYSGEATYRHVFSLQSSRGRIFLDLGRVAVMAQVKLNGKDLGVVWTDPYRVDITAAVKPGENALEITVANLWSNRLIGDQSLPAERRFTFTTWSPYTKDSPLLESGLLGPVRLMSAER